MYETQCLKGSILLMALSKLCTKDWCLSEDGAKAVRPAMTSEPSFCANLVFSNRETFLSDV